jgi:MoxR-like ATPase
MRAIEAAERIEAEVGKVIAGQAQPIRQALTAIVADGHILLEGPPGLAKTLLVRTLAHVMGLEFGRIQFTPDLMPSDIVGTNVFDQRTAEFRLVKGPVFTAILLADEINRTPPKTQAALLEAMEERRVTIDGNSLTLPEPFLVFATQNPLEFEGTYPLPEAQQDRFLMKVLLSYPEPNEEIEVLRRHHNGFRPQSLAASGVEPVLTLESLRAIQAEAQAVQVEEKLFSYIQGLVQQTRASHDLLVGASPRASLGLMNAGKAAAALAGRSYLIPDDVKAAALAVLRHRVIIRPEAEIEGLQTDQILASLIEAQPVPR